MSKAKEKAKAMDHNAKIDELFEGGNQTRLLVDWLAFERSLRQVLCDFNEGRLSMLHALKFIDDYLGAYTLRGRELNGEKK